MAKGTRTDIPQPDPTADRIRAFFDTALKQLGPHGAVATEVVEYTSRSGSKVVAPDQVKGLFTASVALSAPAVVAEVTYGDRELLIMAAASPRLPSWDMFGLWEWQTAAGRPSSTAVDDMNVIRVDVVRRVTDRVCAALLELLPVITSADPKLREHMEGARALAQQAWQVESRDREHRAAMEKAADAFRAGRFAEVVSLLEPFRDIFTPAERAKYEYAKRGQA